ncbi:heme/hemin ABC transporter substrate-binding protein [Subtercola endophyticus]|uniref:heme/hemin ABC transporter substrate-binding protein n=1 Tax=Subtercola endophyticus TaxID=2895559 RepID=UPI001E623AC1|nr:ABC transporter substrate-binding protein [Subtercola endophyticus]UFS58945.1 ABC transporter substrate-binding protein [Subtercola endophyticus]
MPFVRRLEKPARSRMLLPVVLVTTLLLCACSTGQPSDGASSSGSASASAAGGSCADASGTQLPLSEVRASTPPKQLTGPTTACLPSETITALSPAPVPELPTTVVDNQGTSVTVTDASRILALDMSGTLAATVFALGLGGNVVGRDISTGFAEAADLPVVTQGGHTLSAEAILALSPTVIVTDSSIGPWDVLLQMRGAGIPVVVLTPERSIDNAGSIVQGVADALGVSSAGATVTAEVEARIAATETSIAALAPADRAARVRVMFLYVRGSAGVYYIFGAESGADALITSLGAIDVASEIGITDMRPMTAEAIVAAKPDVILMMTKGLESVGGIEGLLEKVPSIALTPAGEKRRIVDMSDYDVLSFGTRTPEVLDALARALYAPEAAARTSAATP